MGRRFTAAFLIASLALLLAGCAAKQSVLTTTDGLLVSPSTPTPTSASEYRKIRPMTIPEKQRLIAANFQVEVPVPFGEVVKGEAQGDTAWDYELIIDAPVAAVASWYQETYLAREWRFMDQNAPQVGSLTLTLTKNAAETRLSITPAAGGKSRVVGVVGVGAPVLQTQ